MAEHPPPLVSTDWLAAQLGRQDVKVLDGSWYMPAQNRDAKAEFAAAHIPGARFFDRVRRQHRPRDVHARTIEGGRVLRATRGKDGRGLAAE